MCDTLQTDTNTDQQVLCTVHTSDTRDDGTLMSSSMRSQRYSSTCAWMSGSLMALMSPSAPSMRRHSTTATSAVHPTTSPPANTLFTFSSATAPVAPAATKCNFRLFSERLSSPEHSFLNSSIQSLVMVVHALESVSMSSILRLSRSGVGEPAPRPAASSSSSRVSVRSRASSSDGV